MPPKRMDESQARTWATFTHLSALSLFIGVPFGNIIGPLVLWLLKRNESDLVDRSGKEALNFHISLTIYLIVSGIFCIILIGIPFVIGFAIAGLILTIIGSIKVSNGEDYRYPMAIQFLN